MLTTLPSSDQPLGAAIRSAGHRLANARQMVITRSELHRAALQDLRDAKVLEREAAADLLDLVREAGDLLDRLPTVVGSSAPRSRRSR